VIYGIILAGEGRVSKRRVRGWGEGVSDFYLIILLAKVTMNRAMRKAPMKASDMTM